MVRCPLIGTRLFLFDLGLVLLSDIRIDCGRWLLLDLLEVILRRLRHLLRRYGYLDIWIAKSTFHKAAAGLARLFVQRLYFENLVILVIIARYARLWIGLRILWVIIGQVISIIFEIACVMVIGQIIILLIEVHRTS